jgi:hypothetical protein
MDSIPSGSCKILCTLYSAVLLSPGQYTTGLFRRLFPACDQRMISCSEASEPASEKHHKDKLLPVCSNWFIIFCRISKKQ